MKAVLYEIPDDEVVAAVGQWGNRSMTYVVRNILAPGRPNLGTPQVLRQLKRLEKEGRVARTWTHYAVQICWTAPTQGTA